MSVTAGGVAERANGALVSGNYFSGLGIKAIRGRTLVDDDDAVTLSNQSLAANRFNFMSYSEPDGRKIAASAIYVRGNFFDVMGIPITLGRAFKSGERSVAVVNETFARLYFRDANPIGKMAWDSDIVGVVRDAKVRNVRQDIPPVLYFPYEQQPDQLTFEVRTAGDPSGVIPSVRKAVMQLDTRLALYSVTTQEEEIARTFSDERLFAGFAAAFGAMALFLVGVGLYGTVSYTVTQRTHEIGIRMALGATRWRVIAWIMRDMMVLVLAGAALAIGSAFVINQTATKVKQELAQLLFGLESNDVLTCAVAVMVLLAVAVLAGLQPARRASRVDPTVALRCE